MGFWNRSKAADDLTSIGSLLTSGGYCSEEDLERALRFQKDNPDIMLGETLLRMGIIDIETLEVMLVRQKVARKGSQSAIHKLADLALSRTINASASLDVARTLAAEATEKLK